MQSEAPQRSFQVEISDLDVSRSELSTSFFGSTLRKINFSLCHWDECNLAKARFADCTFDQGKLHVHFNDTVFENCGFVKTRLVARQAYASYGGVRAKFHSCNFGEAIIRSYVFRASQFHNCDFQAARFENCDFRGVKFYGSIPSLQQFHDCNLEHVQCDGKYVFEKVT